MLLPSPRISLAGTCALALLALTAPAMAQTTRLSPTAAPTGGAVRVEPGGAPTPAGTGVTAGGALEHPGCGGFVTARPQVVITTTGDLPWLRVYATSATDTSLAILGPNNQWRCADDTYGANPSIDGRFRRGTYRVWVATATSGATAPATVTVTAQRTQRASDAPVAEAPTTGGNTQDPMAAATGLAQQVLAGLGGNGVNGGNGGDGANTASPLSVPLSTLSRAGLSPNGLPGPLDTVLRQPNPAAANLTPAQLTQLAELARGGASTQALQTALASMVRGVGTAR